MLAYPGAEPVLEKVLNTLEEIHMGAGMACTMIFARVPPSGWQPMVILNLWYAGTNVAKNAFAKLFQLGPVMNMCAPTPFNKMNSANEDACAKGGRKPVSLLAWVNWMLRRWQRYGTSG
jgi:hypothetical protein